MKLFGTVAELVKAVFRANNQQVELKPNTSTTYTATRTVELPEGDANHVLVSRDSTDTLTNKSLTAAQVTDFATAVSSNAAVAANTTKVSADGSIDTHSDVDVSSTPPVNGDVLTYDGSNWVPGTGGAGSGEKNYIANPSMVGDSTGWTASGAGITVARETTAANLPEESLGAAIKITPVSGTTDYVRARFQLDDVDKSRKLKIQWQQKPDASYAAGDLVVELYSNSASDYSGSYTQLTLDTSDIPAGTGEFLTTFDSTSADYFELRIRRAAGTAPLYISSVTVGPGSVASGAAVGPTTTYTPTIGATTTAPTPGTGATLKGSWRQVGDQMEWQFDFSQSSAGSGGSGNYLIPLPSGVTIDTSKFAALSSYANAVVGSCQVRGGSTYFNGLVIVNDSTHLLFTLSNDVSAPNNVWASSAAGLGNTPVSASGTARFPIAEWAGKGTLSAGTNRVEYVSHDGTNIVYGSNGAAMLTTTPAGTSDTYDITAGFTNVQPTDAFRFEVQRGGSGPWTPYDDQFGPFMYENGVTSFVGAGVYAVGSTVYLARGKYRTNASGPWSAIAAGTRWRVVKHSAGVPVGYGQATSTQYGLTLAPTEGSFTLTLSDRGCVIPTMTINYIKTGKIVTLYWSDTTGLDLAGTSTFAISTACVPTAIRPAARQYAGHAHSSVTSALFFAINSDGTISISTDDNTTMNGAGGTADTIYAGCATYVVAS